MATVTHIPIVSSSLLSVVNSSQPVFQPLPVYDEHFFDEGPRVLTVKKPSTVDQETSLSNLSSSYAWTQGVEMNRQAMYDAGLAKIWSGDAGHQLKPAVFGQDKDFFPGPGFVDIDLFSPAGFLRAQIDSSALHVSITFPIVVGNSDQLESYNFNGVIEPFPIRPVITLFSMDVPFEVHQPRASLEGGNTSVVAGSDRVMTVDYFDRVPGHGVIPYHDLVDFINPGTEHSGTWSSGSWSGGHLHSGNWVGSGIFTPSDAPTGAWLNGYFQRVRSPLLPFIDQKLNRNDTPNDGSEDAILVDSMDHMSGNTDNYVRYDQVSSPCGWDYDRNAAIGTDSLAFGGMTY